MENLVDSGVERAVLSILLMSCVNSGVERAIQGIFSICCVKSGVERATLGNCQYFVSKVV